MCTVFLLIDGTFVATNLAKVLDGGWLPLLIGGVILTAMISWHRGAPVARLSGAPYAIYFNVYEAS
jgi:K+ transporter